MWMRGSRGIAPRPNRAAGFTFVELLVVAGLMSALIALLMPTLSAARAQSQMTCCESNVRQLLIALNSYAVSYGKYPPNLLSPAPGAIWHDQDRLGPYVSCVVASDGSLIGGIMACPADEGGKRSYAMNIWASSKVDHFVTATIGTLGTLWSTNTCGSDQMILIGEKWGSSKLADGWVTEEPFGYAGYTPGQRFGVNGGIAPPERAEYGWMINSELPFARHRLGHDAGTGPQPIGRVTIGYADGHVEMKRNDELADARSGLSTLDSQWSPLDAAINH
jgi:prepilin-type processing-associated H-X9-DG protein